MNRFCLNLKFAVQIVSVYAAAVAMPWQRSVRLVGGRLCQSSRAVPFGTCAFLLCALCLAPVASGQAGGSAAAQPTVRFQTFLWKQYKPASELADITIIPEYVAPKVRYVDERGAAQPLGAVERSFSPVHEFRGQHLRFVNEEISAQTGEVVHVPVADVQLPAGASQVVLIFFPKAEAPTEQYHVLAVPASAADVVAGRMLVFNITNELLAAKIGEQQLSLAPGASLPVAAVRAGGRPVLPLLVGSQDAGGQWVRRHRRNLVVSPEAGSLLFLYREGDRYRSMLIDMPAEPGNR